MYHSVRSPLAEALARSLFPGRFIAESAGIAPSGLNRYTVQVLAEIGISLPDFHPRPLSEFRNTEFDYVVTLCNHARNACAGSLPYARMYLHHNFPMRDGCGVPEKTALTQFRIARRSIQEWLLAEFGQVVP